MSVHQRRIWVLPFLAPLVLCLLATGTALAQEEQPVVLASSTFDVDAEGWVVTGDAQTSSGGIPIYVPSGGNPGGYVSAIDDETGGIWYWQAPPKFLGNMLDAYGNSLSFDLRQSATSQQREAPDVVLKSTSATLYYDTSNNPGKTWTSYSVLLSEAAGWKKADGTVPTQLEMKMMLVDVTALRIRGEYRSDSDIGDLDNVILKGVKAAHSVYLPFARK